MLKSLLDLVSLSTIMSLWCFKLCDMVVVNQVEVASSWWISVARKGMDVVCSSADTDCDESHVHIKMVFIYFFFKWPFSELLSNDWDCCSTYARPGVALWRHSLKPEKTSAEYRNNRGCYIETGLGLNGAKMIFGWNKCGKKEYSAHHQTSDSSKHQAEPSTQGWTDSCLNVYAKFWLNHLNAATAVVTH